MTWLRRLWEWVRRMVRKVLVHDTDATPEQQFELESSVAPLFVVERTLTAAEIHTLNSVPTVLVEGIPGSVILPSGGWLVYHFGTSGYVNTVQVFVGTPALVAQGQQWLVDSITNPGILGQVVSSISALREHVGAQRELTWAEGEDLLLIMDGSDPDPAPDGDGTLDVVVFYRIVDVTP